MYHFLDILLTVTHLALIGFNLLGWIWTSTRKWHLACIILTAGSWFVLGIWFGMGYCPITDWQWQVKAKLGETNLPDSFITYFAEKLTGKNISDNLIDLVTAISFFIAALLAVYFNFFKRRKPVKIRE